jgi:hypothetical protein
MSDTQHILSQTGHGIIMVQRPGARDITANWTTITCYRKKHIYIYICKRRIFSSQDRRRGVSSSRGEGRPVLVRHLLSSKRRPHFKTPKSLRNNKNMGMGPYGTRNQDWLCWRGPATIYLPRPDSGSYRKVSDELGFVILGQLFTSVLKTKSFRAYRLPREFKVITNLQVCQNWLNIPQGIVIIYYCFWRASCWLLFKFLLETQDGSARTLYV